MQKGPTAPLLVVLIVAFVVVLFVLSVLFTRHTEAKQDAHTRFPSDEDDDEEEQEPPRVSDSSLSPIYQDE